MKYWRRISITRKITILIFLVTYLVSGIGFSVYLFLDIQKLKKTIVTNSITEARWIGANCVTSLDFEIKEPAQDILNRLSEIAEVENCAIYNKYNAVHASYTKKNVYSPIPTTPNSVKPRFIDSYLIIYEPIINEDKLIGLVYLKIETNIVQHIRDRVKIILWVLIGVLLLTFVLAFIFQKIITQPILKLAQLAGEVTNHKDYSVRISKRDEDEIGILYDEFNEMLNVIQHQEIERIAASDVIKNLNSELERKVVQRTRKLELANRELNELAYISAHDLKTPLRGISQLAAWLTMDYIDRFDDDGKKQLHLLMSRVTRMNNLVNGLLKYTTVSRFEIKEFPVLTNMLINEIIRELKPSDNVEITINPNMPVLYGERTHFKLLFFNIIENAIKFTDKSKTCISVDYEELEDFYKFSITDNGCGIDVKYFDKVFKIFQTLSSDYENESTGIGLPLAKKIVELYDGEIWLESELNISSTVYFTIKNKQNNAQ